MRQRQTRLFVVACVAVLAGSLGSAQQNAAAPRVLTAADYARAERFMTYNTTPLVSRSGVRPNWLPDDRFWYRVTTPARAARRFSWTRRPARRGRAICPACAESGRGGGGRGRGGGWRPGRSGAQRRALARRQARRVHQGLEPLGARRRDRQGNAAHHRRREGLRLRHRQRRLDAAATARSSLWSPDSKKIATFQQDQRNVGEMYLVSTDGRPSRRCRPWKYPLPGDDDRHDDPARRHRRRRARKVVRLQDAARPAPLDAVRRRRVPRQRVGRRAVEPGRIAAWRSSRPRATTSTSSCASPTPSTGAVRDVLDENGRRRSSSPATAASTGGTCRRRTR